ncbi:MAG: hypothetical protein D4R65_11205 [Verrucomicrobiaceae bacterium]|nr:MAG: hypothetical protein D4R65_11205 [Verrucomicrobiaceae bacterium]
MTGPTRDDAPIEERSVEDWMINSSPIIFIHYGPAHYLKWTLKAARRTNPDKRIVLLGDPSNRRFVGGGVQFVDFETLAGGEKEGEFQKVFQVIQGERHRFNKHGGIEAWLKFVFRRWFLIEEFLLREKIDSFWTFDSDTLLLAPLGPREARFSDVEATTQCRDECLNGWIGSRNLVDRYTRCMIELFRDPVYLEAQRERLRTHAGLAFNEMDAFGEFRQRESIKTWHGEMPNDGEMFDDALAFGDGFESSPEKVLGKTAIKRLWTDGNSIFAKKKESGQFVRMLTCNMSWMPDYVWRRVIAATRSGGDESRGTGAEERVIEENLREISVREPAADCILRQAKVAIFKMQRTLGVG